MREAGYRVKHGEGAHPAGRHVCLFTEQQGMTSSPPVEESENTVSAAKSGQKKRSDILGDVNIRKTHF